MKYLNNTLNVINTNENIGKLYFEISALDNLSEGDIVLVKLYSFDNSLIDKIVSLGYTIPRTIRYITVPDLGEYITSQNQLSSVILEAIKDSVDSEYEVTNVMKLYYCTYKPGVECPYKSTSFVTVIYHEHNGWWGDIYNIAMLNDINIKPDSTIVVGQHSLLTWNNKSMADAEASLDTTKYNYVEID